MEWLLGDLKVSIVGVKLSAHLLVKFIHRLCILALFTKSCPFPLFKGLGQLFSIIFLTGNLSGTRW